MIDKAKLQIVEDELLRIIEAKKLKQSEVDELDKVMLNIVKLAIRWTNKGLLEEE